MLIETTVETFIRTIIWAIVEPFVEPFIETFVETFIETIVETIIRLPSILVLRISRALSGASRRVFAELGRVRMRWCYLL